MKKDTLLKLLAEKGYVISYAANLNFATYDIVTGLPPKTTYISLAISIIGLSYQKLNINWITIPMLLLSIACLYLDKYKERIQEYKARGIKNTDQWNTLKRLYYTVKDSDENADFSEIEATFQSIENEFNNSAEADQIFCANWFAHYKLFYEKDYAWMNDQLHFSFWKDKIPKSLKALLITVLLIAAILFCIHCPVVSNFFRNLFCFCYE
jgi:TRAP-type C4-dicarboxylate transport system permease large subunit